ncbi:hypothetical protein [Streptomyces herbicida]|uniref:hypothetical protein n=1 Tax=Streptomyces herbicida TaxID=3065675 RepID=UPI00292F41D7|nr:hypothetical protein [Streptomyces sp. NEAU-HV9]
MSGGSARAGRAKAGPASLHYRRARGRTTAAPAREPRRRRFDRNKVILNAGGCLLAVAIVGLAALTRLWGPRIWTGLAPAWPDGGDGFAVTAGVVLPWTAAAAILPLCRIDWDQPGRRWMVRFAQSVPGTVSAAAVLVVLMGAHRSERGHRGPSCFRAGGPCWVHQQYPHIGLVVLGAVAGSGALLILLLSVSIRSRKKRSQSAT